ncbi:hypothetical protein Tco_0895272 [Tanacetum coccineum]|uniref:Uncharacterized protein n=1 Tax=Tanacetum coccineum TaxID=301880 RepID=A0ABQ5CE59_9ASTR
MLDDGDSTMKMKELIEVGKSQLEKVNAIDFVMIDYINEWEPSIIFGRDFLVTTKSKVDFRLRELRIDITMLKEDRDVDTLLANLVGDMVEIREISREVVNMDKASGIKNYNVNKLTRPTSPKIEEIPLLSSSAPQPIFHPLSPKQKEKILEALDRKKKLDEVMMGRAMPENKDFTKEEKEKIVENGLPKKLKNPEEDLEEDLEEEPEPNNGLVNRFAPHVDPHQPGVMIGWLEENDGVNEGVNNEDIEDEDVEIELNDDAELIFPYEVEGDKTPPPRDESSDSEPPNAEPPNAEPPNAESSDSVSSDSESSDSESEDEEADIAPEATVGTVTQRPFAVRDFLRGILEVGESSSARDSSYVGGLAPWALRRDLETSRLRARLTEAELSTNQAEIALLKSKNKIGKKRERELLDHDLGDVERTLGNVLEMLKVLESGENATLKKRLTETETKLAWARMERDIAEERLHVSRVWNKRFYIEMVRIGAVPKPPSDDEGTERLRKKSKKSSFDGTEGPSEPRGPPSDS